MSGREVLFPKPDHQQRADLFVSFIKGYLIPTLPDDLNITAHNVTSETIERFKGFYEFLQELNRPTWELDTARSVADKADEDSANFYLVTIDLDCKEPDLIVSYGCFVDFVAEFYGGEKVLLEGEEDFEEDEYYGFCSHRTYFFSAPETLIH